MLLCLKGVIVIVSVPGFLSFYLFSIDLKKQAEVLMLQYFLSNKCKIGSP